MSASNISPYVPSSLSEAEAFAAKLAKTALVPPALRDKPLDILMVMAAGHELGFSPLASLRNIDMINGEPSLSGAATLAVCLSSPCCLMFEKVETTATRATFKTQRRGGEIQHLTWTIEQAQRARLVDRNPSWKLYPENMLRWRCVKALADLVYPDVVRGMPLTEDLITHPSATDAIPSVITGTVEVIPEAHSDDVQTLPVETQPVDPATQMLERIQAASTIAELRRLAGPITEAKLGAHPEIRDAYAARQAQMRRAGGTR